VRAPLLAATAVASAAGWLGPGAAAHCPRLARLLDVPLGLDECVGVALTFDDGPHPVGTRLVLDVLAARATFFLVGEQVQRCPSLVSEMVATGHQPAVRGYLHRNQMRLGPRRFAADLRLAIAVIAEASGRAPEYYRPPYGAFTPVGVAHPQKPSPPAIRIRTLMNMPRRPTRQSILDADRQPSNDGGPLRGGDRSDARGGDRGAQRACAG
jgi:peptidoglycan/xylan/chitin deacetylase (PgdA/CDA1 family)